MTTSEPTLLDRVNADPNAVEAEDVVREIRNVNPDEFPTLLSAVGRMIDRNPGRAHGVVDAVKAEIDVDEDVTRVAATRVLATTAAAAPEAIIPVLSDIEARFGDESPPVRGAALRVFVSLCETHPEEVTRRLDSIASLIRDPVPFVGETAMEVVRTIELERDQDLETIVAELVGTLDDPPEFDPIERRRWMRYHPTYLEWLDREGVSTSDRERYLATASRILARLSFESPNIASKHVSTIADIIEREQSTPVRVHLLDMISFVADNEPGVATPAIAPVSDMLLEAHTDSFAAKAAWTLAWLAEGDSADVADAVNDAVPELQTMLESDDEDLVGGVTAVLSHVAEHNPEAVEAVNPRARELLEEENKRIRGLAVWILAYTGAKEDQSRLDRLSKEDPDPEIREAAADALVALETTGRE